jgi:hypothetical protein
MVGEKSLRSKPLNERNRPDFVNDQLCGWEMTML